MLCKELEEIANKGELTAGSLETVHKLTDTIKNIDKIEMYEEYSEDGYSEDGEWMGEGRMYGTSYEGGSSYARGGRGRGRNAKRDSMGRYSRDMMHHEGNMSYARAGKMVGRGGRGNYSRDDAKDYMMEQLEELMEQAEKPQEKEALKRCMQAIERA
jgi:hypothetical protein